MKVTTSSGMTIEGTEREVTDAMKRLGISVEEHMYKSSTRGWLVISEMESTHLRNAMLKIYSEWVNSLHAIKSPKNVVEAVIEGCTDKTFQAMVLELHKRS